MCESAKLLLHLFIFTFGRFANWLYWRVVIECVCKVFYLISECTLCEFSVLVLFRPYDAEDAIFFLKKTFPVLFLSKSQYRTFFACLSKRKLHDTFFSQTQY